MMLSHLLKDKTAILRLLRRLPIRPDKRLRIFNFVKKIFYKIYYPQEISSFYIITQPFTPSGLYYGHDFWMKKYSGYSDNIYAHIEHGVYFGENKEKIGEEEEWNLGSVITYGDSRKRLLEDLYPDYNVIPIGPRIHYATTDIEYYNELYNQIDHNGKVLTLFPAHSIANEKSLYDSELFLKQADDLAKQIGAKTIMVSLHPSDYLHNLDLGFKDSKVIFVGGGNDSIKFLPRLRAIFELSDLTFSNAIGTHIGYSIYMGTPHVLNIESNHYVSKNPIFEQEQKKFASVFNGDTPLRITGEQRELCNYYFGFSYIKTSEELFNCLISCKMEYEKRYKRH